MMNFTLPDWTKAKLKHVNIRGETHGDKVVPAFDLALVVTVGNEVLESFAPGLTASLFDGETQGTLEGVPHSVAPLLRYPQLGPLSWKEEAAGYDLAIDGGSAGVTLSGLKVNTFALKPLAGGAVEVDFRCQSQGEQTPATLGCLGSLVQRNVLITLAPTTSG